MQRKKEQKATEGMKEKVERRELNEVLKNSLVYYSMCPGAFACMPVDNIMFF